MALASWFWGESTTESNYGFDSNVRMQTFGEKDDSGAGYSYGPTKGWKSKSKSSEKKQAAMSALTLIAFLFFLNILQNCLQDDTEEVAVATVVMMTPAVAQQAQNKQPDHEELNNNFQSRKLMSVEDKPQRSSKFIKDFHIMEKDWSNELSQVSEDDLRDHKEKMEKLRVLWNNKNERKESVKKFVNHPILSDLRGHSKISNLWNNEKTAEETKSVDFEEPKRQNADFKEFEKLKEPNLLEKDTSLVHEAAEKLQSFEEEEKALTQTPVYAELYNTPRNRRSDLLLPTPMSAPFQGENRIIQIVTPSPTNDQNSETTKQYAVYTNPSQISSTFWQTTTSSPTKNYDIDNIHLTTPNVYYNTYKNHRKYYRAPLKKVPFRKAGYEPAIVRHEYYPMEVVGQYAGPYDQGPAVGIFQLFWSMMRSFTNAVLPIMPHVSKISKEAHCIDLITCEVHRLGNLMGPTAKAMATYFSTFLSWMIPETNKANFRNAINSGDTNSCWEQISACDERSGRQSLLPLIAQLLEVKAKDDAYKD